MIYNMTIGITGASGHIGSRLKAYLTEKGFNVVAFVRNIGSIKDVPRRKYDLTESISDDLFSDVDILIHCAFVTKQQHADAERINYNGSKYLFDECRKQGVKKIIFFSTVTANANAKSAYAKSKFAIGQLLRSDVDYIIKCSMVIGRGGLFQRILRYATTHFFIPVIGSGDQIIRLVAVDDVLLFVEQVIVRNLKGSAVLANNERMTYKQFFNAIAEVYGRKITFIHVSVVLLKIILRLCTLLNIHTPVSEENISGMQTLSKYDHPPNFPSFQTFKEKLIELRSED
jgi:nucleoside-diphosphate-sugar epimerase